MSPEELQEAVQQIVPKLTGVTLPCSAKTSEGMCCSAQACRQAQCFALLQAGPCLIAVPGMSLAGFYCARRR